MQNFVISPDGRILRWTCTSCQHDNFFVANSLLYPDRVKWRCGGCRSTAIVYRPDKWIEEAMSEYTKIHRDGQRSKWRQPNVDPTDPNPKDSPSRNHIDVCAAFLTERPNLTSGRHIVNEESDNATASRTLDAHVKNSVLLPEKSRIDAHR
jgi:hypothetical protein